MGGAPGSMMGSERIRLPVKKLLRKLVVVAGTTAILGVGGQAVVAISPAGAAAATPQCANGSDDDGDGLVDTQDPGCTATFDETEFSDTSLGSYTGPTGGLDTATFAQDPGWDGSGNRSPDPLCESR